MSQVRLLRRWLSGHARSAFANSRAPVPWPHMLECGAATAVPTLVGLMNGELGLAVYGGLTGYLMALNDHFGALHHRVLVATLSFVALAAAFALGMQLQDSPTLFLVVMGGLTYWLGLMGGTGAEAERLLLFALIELVCVQHLPTFTPVVVNSVLPYGLLALGTLYAAQVISDRYAPKHLVKTFARLGPSVRGSMTRQVARHRFACNYTLATILAAYLAERHQIERGYWMIITVLLVMRPDVREGIYRPLQRLVGTLFGVLIGDLLILTINIKALLVFGVFLSSFGVPLAVRRNYWLVSFFATIMVLLFLTLPSTGRGETHLPFVRLLATAYGCGLSGAVTLVSAAIAGAVRPRAGADRD